MSRVYNYRHAFVFISQAYEYDMSGYNTTYIEKKKNKPIENEQLFTFLDTIHYLPFPHQIERWFWFMKIKFQTFFEM